MRKIYILISILMCIFSYSDTLAGQKELEYLNKSYDILKLLKYNEFLLPENIRRASFETIYPESKSHVMLYKNIAYKISLYYTDDKTYSYSSDEKGKLLYFFCQNRMENDEKYIRFVEKNYPKKLTEKELLKKGREYISLLIPEVDQKEFRVRRFEHWTYSFDKSKSVFISYERNVKGFDSTEYIVLYLLENGILETIVTSYTDEDCEINIKVTKEEAEEKAVELIKAKINGEEGIKEFIDIEYGVRSVQRITDEKVKVFSEREIKDRELLRGLNGLNLSKPVVIHPNYKFFKESNSILKKENMKGYYKDVGIERLRLVWAVIVSLGNKGEKIGYGGNFYVVYVDCETGEIIGGF